MLTLESLPAELLYQIHLFSLSPHLPYVSRHLFSIFHHSTTTHRALYLTLTHPRKTLQSSIYYPLCTLPVLHTLEQIAKKRRKILSCPELPKRLFRVQELSKPNAPRPTSPVEGNPLDIPLITYLLTTYSSSPSLDGYPLARAVLGRHLPLIRLLLAFGADPSLGEDGPVAVMLAVRRGDLEVVKMLLEREVVREEAVSEEEGELGGGEGKGESKKKKRRRRSSGGGGKRRKTEESTERMKATSAMIQVAVRAKANRRPMVDYLSSRGAVPSVESLGRMIGPEWD